ncbi:LysR family transcriptional regulator [Verminephrobacter eiseniae]|uniref:LysR family transcriptional regulator n=1 Tax=Verminephrobacter eiseniae TaxID=364317 RepID=UPI0022378CF1|nr:LysR family transcriptional regulator [Verminephrobacter eiseniae]MCW5238961.1 LysR family transcriptional regulator [Verminephrobacter eiseniae]
MAPQFADLDLRLIRVFLAIVDAGGLSAAQRTLNVSQPTLSSQLATLETRLGFSLCVRGRGGFQLTPKGERFTPIARRLIDTLSDFSAQAHHLERQLVGSLNIGLIGYAPIEQNRRIAQAIARFRQRDEAVRFVIIVRSPSHLEEQLVSGQIQVAVGYFWRHMPTLEYTPLFSERQLAYCGREHPLFDRAGQLMPDELSGCDWVWRSYPLPEAQQWLPALQITAVTDNMEATAVLVLSGRHLGYLPEHFAASYVEAGLLAPVNPAVMYYDVQFHMVSRRRERLNDITLAFLEDLGQAQPLAQSGRSKPGT